ncbi:hypothetical protein [Rhodoferax sp.]|uniref:hypothetical protein n=1 Tax=Rhodoferax sp. TaxID=50421 RepID=UPI00374DBFCC
MAGSIVTDSALFSDTPGISISPRNYCDVYHGTAEALVVAGMIDATHLVPQKGRAIGHTAFLPSGEPCPHRVRAYREPGFKTVRQNDDGTICVEITVAKDVQSSRLACRRAAETEAEQERINQSVAEDGHKYRNWVLQHGFGSDCEYWEGTKEQLQAEGLCVGMAFPGEPGVIGDIYGKCPLGFEVRIYLPTYYRAKAAARIYTAQGWYKQSERKKTADIQFSPGVVIKGADPKYSTTSDTYAGTAEALVAANVVPSLDLFPGEPGRNRVRASYVTGWLPCIWGSQASKNSWVATISIKSKGRFSVEVPVCEEEKKRREAVRDEVEEKDKKVEAILRSERQQLRTASTVSNKTIEEFRAERLRLAEDLLATISRGVFTAPDGPLSFDLSSESNLKNKLMAAFQLIRDAAMRATVIREKSVGMETHKSSHSVVAREAGGQQLMHNKLSHLRLVHTAISRE